MLLVMMMLSSMGSITALACPSNVFVGWRR
ncbi:hypothetical protein Golax_020742 [Gossypium laxum]|uniref:Uncharacterized protein n=1 Tax=Gossypium laxum TaxID=34288 RepID=A0A7J9AIW6_9ROSI|nr:hypothetical protein [Gossypium laxum]